jgi:hypothetical protein
MLDPPPDRDVIHGQAALRHDLLQVAIGKRISQVPANAQKNDDIGEMSPAERRGRVWLTASPYQKPRGHLQHIRQT